VFTRTVADPYAGGKLTGKQGSHLAGVFVTQDRQNNLLFPANEGSDSTTLDQDVTGTVGRYRLDVGKGSTVGGLYSGREGGDYFNRQVGADTFIRLNPSDSIRFQFIHSETRYPDQVAKDFAQPEGAFGGDAWTVQVQHFTRKWIAFGSFDSYSPGFRSDSGFVPQVDVRMVNGQVRRRFQRGGPSWFNLLDFGVRGMRGTTYDWDLREQSVAGFLNYQGPYQSFVFFSVPRDVVVYAGQRYEFWRPRLTFGIKPTGDVNLEVFGRFGGGVDYTNARAATDVLQLGTAFEYRPVKRVNLRLTYDLEQLSVEGGRLYQANLTQVKAVYHLNVRTFVRAILQYTDITRDEDLYLVPVSGTSRRLFQQYLFSFKLNPQTVLFAGYSDNSAGSGALHQSIDLRQQNRTFFVKIGYAWVL
jgi:hypothetical protein